MSEPVSDVTPALLKEIWNQMVIKIKHPNLYLPVDNVKTVDHEGCVGRSMEGKIIEENIYSTVFDGEVGEIRFVVLERGVESDVEIINVLLKDPVRIEYYQRNKNTKERIFWHAPKEACLHSINKTIENAAGAKEEVKVSETDSKSK